jgi:hypothetical protein
MKRWEFSALIRKLVLKKETNVTSSEVRKNNRNVALIYPWVEEKQVDMKVFIFSAKYRCVCSKSRQV